MPLVVIEGPQGSGKTTQAVVLQKTLIELGFTVKSMREPGTTQLGERIRDLVFSMDMSPTTAGLLFSASRRHMVETFVMQSLSRDEVVILDCYWMSQYVYQGLLSDPEEQKVLCEIGSMGLQADIVIILDEDHEACLRKGRHGEPARLPHAREACEAYKKLARENQQWHALHGMSASSTSSAILGIVLPLLHSHYGLEQDHASYA